MKPASTEPRAIHSEDVAQTIKIQHRLGLRATQN
jgi:hypothetical protein